MLLLDDFEIRVGSCKGLRLACKAFLFVKLDNPNGFLHHLGDV